MGLGRPRTRAFYAAALLAAGGGGSLVNATCHAAISPSTGCVAANRKETRTLESQCYSIQHAGVTRTFRLYVPQEQKAHMPLVLVLHGGGGGGGAMEWLTKEGFNRIADRDGVIIAYPDGIKHHWNDGRFDPHARSGDESIDDLGFLRELPKEISASFPVDPKRVYATGISNGGLMSYRLACDAADIFAAVAPVAANMSEALATRCKPSKPVSMAIFNGTDDPIMPWKGGPIKVLWFDRGAVLSTSATQARWLELDQCASPHENGLVNAVPDDGTAILEHSAQCASKTELDLYEIQGGGHTWPGGEPYLGKRLIGNVSRELDANQAIWQFFAKHTL